MRKFLVGLGVVIFLASISLALWLLMQGKFSGAEFASFVVAFAVIALIVGYAPEVQEISIAGNVVKLKEIKAEAVKAIESLNESRVEMLRIFLGLALKHAGGFGSSGPVDPRVPEFWELYKLIKKFDCEKQLRDPIVSSLNVLMVAQLRAVSNRNLNLGHVISDPCISPFELSSVAFDPEGISLAEERTSPRPTNYKDEIIESIYEYSRLFELKRELMAEADSSS